MWYCFTTAKGVENWSRAVHVRPRGFERCTAIFGASFAGLFWALQAPCSVASNCKERHASTPQIYTRLDDILAHLLVSPWLTKNMQFFRVDQSVLHVDTSPLGCVACWHVPFGILWRYESWPTYSHGQHIHPPSRSNCTLSWGIFDGFYYMFTGEGTSKADNFDNLGLMKILNTPLTQKRSGIRTEWPTGTKPPDKKGCN